MKPDQRTRFDANWTPEPNTGCFLWFGAHLPRGYGRFCANGRTQLAHRLAWQWANGRSAGDLVVRHRCDTPSCVNPDHLEIGTQAENLSDCMKRGRARYVPLRGESNGMARLTAQAVREIRNLIGTESGVSLAKRYGVTPTMIGRIKSGRAWRHLA